MGFRLAETDLDILSTVADCRILAIGQLQSLLQRNAAALRRRLGVLDSHGYIGFASQVRRSRPGRPERIVLLTRQGVNALKDSGKLGNHVPVEKATGEGLNNLEHHLLLNEFRVQIAQLERVSPALSVSLLASESPYILNEKGYPEIYESFASGTADQARFTPDAVLAVRRRDTSQAVLFYLEVDMGTESLSSPDPLTPDVQTKVRNYKACFRSAHYKRHQRTFGATLNGFRLLFLTADASRLTSLCQLILQGAPAELIWLTDRASLESRGVWAPIWIPGGDTASTRKSILGSMAPNPAPVPSDLP